jgi:NAD(P)-dependent dehydrogenase (short-subunit alcohol dehydrogenase family)
VLPPDDPHRPVEAADVAHDRLFRLDGNAYVVFGGAGGVGEHISRTLRAQGARLLCVDVDADRAEHIGKALDVSHVVADVTTAEGVDTVRQRAQAEFDALHGYVDVIGQMQRKPLREYTIEDWDRDLRVNLRHAFLVAQGIAPMVAASRDGAIVYVSTSMAGRAGRLAPGYGPAKAALQLWVKQLAAEYGPSGVRVNAVAPGLFLSPRFVGNDSGRAAAEMLAGRTMLGRLGQPYEIAATVTFLLTPAAGYITGTTVPVEGGALSTDSTGLDDVPL